MRWGAMLMAYILATASSALAADTSPIFGGASQTPFQLVVNSATGQPVLVQSPASEPAVQAAK